ncbi:MAG: protein-L-isoaspartate O-methyltransferase, partial [Spirochaetaceae bacterium]
MFLPAKKAFAISTCCFICVAALFLYQCSNKAHGNPGTPTPQTGVSGRVDGNQPHYDLRLRTENPPVDSLASYLAWMASHTKEDKAQLTARYNRAAAAIAAKDLQTPKVIIAFLRTPREYFAREKNWARAYIHNYMDIGYGQTISGPHIVSHMTSELDVEIDHKVLEIGTGSGYQAALLSQLSNHVFTIEVIKPLAEETDAIYRKYETVYPEFQNVHRKIADGYYGWEEEAPFDRIIVTCGIDHIPPPLLQQLKPEGIMLIPVGPVYHQHVLRIVKHVDAAGTVTLEKRDICDGREVPFV